MEKIYFKDILSLEALENIARCECWRFEREKVYDDNSWPSGHYWNVHKGELLFSISCGQKSKRTYSYKRNFSYAYYAQSDGGVFYT